MEPFVRWLLRSCPWPRFLKPTGESWKRVRGARSSSFPDGSNERGRKSASCRSECTMVPDSREAFYGGR
jgi:hypothetical protein